MKYLRSFVLENKASIHKTKVLVSQETLNVITYREGGYTRYILV